MTKPNTTGKQFQERRSRLRWDANARRRAVYAVRGRPARNPPPPPSDDEQPDFINLDDLLAASSSDGEEEHDPSAASSHEVA